MTRATTRLAGTDLLAPNDVQSREPLAVGEMQVAHLADLESFTRCEYDAATDAA